MDIVIPLGGGSRWDNNELRYCLRSVQKYVKDVGEIIIIGVKPKWIKNVVHIPCDDDLDPEAKEKNILKKVLLACDLLDGDFMFMNDDHFLLSPVTLPYPSYFDFQLPQKLIGRTLKGRYYKAQVNTIKALTAKSLPLKNFDIHVPMIYNRDLFRKAMAQYDWKVPFGYVIKSLYANTYQIPGTFMPDCKLSKRMVKKDIMRILKHRSVFSIGDGALNSQLKSVLHDLYPNPSRYEQ